MFTVWRNMDKRNSNRTPWTDYWYNRKYFDGNCRCRLRNEGSITEQRANKEKARQSVETLPSCFYMPTCSRHITKYEKIRTKKELKTEFLPRQNLTINTEKMHNKHQINTKIKTLEKQKARKPLYQRIYRLLILALRTGVEPVLQEWESCVLTTSLTEQLNCYLL